MNVLIIIPTYNERDNLPLLVGDLMRHDGYRVMVVDDRSPDGTGEVAEELAREYPGRIEVLRRTGVKGLGRSYIEGMSRAVKSEADVICQMDADFSHDPKYLPGMVEASRTNDLVLGSRYLQGVSVVNWPLHRLALSVFANRYVRTVTRLPVHDCSSGFRCWRREALVRVLERGIVSEGYAFQFEMLYETSRLGFRIAEVPIVFVERRQGTSKMSKRVMLEALLTPWRLVLRKLWSSERRAA
ncbi:MAG: polyprenol monophosphomannose synthase [Acidobacteria bacterium]|nr:polyprenol monophosphomannose synthase [Acidobacteriota bacterium]